MRRRQIRQALYKPHLIMGCEKLPLAIVAFISLITAVLAPTIITKIVGILFGFSLMMLIKFLNSKEPYIFEILYRYLKFQKFYLNIAKYPSKPMRIRNFK